MTGLARKSASDRLTAGGYAGRLTDGYAAAVDLVSVASAVGCARRLAG